MIIDYTTRWEGPVTYDVLMLGHLHMYTTFCFVYVCVWRYFKMSCVTDPCVRFKIWRSLPEGPKNWMPSVDGSVAGSTWTVFSWSWVSSGRCAWSWSWWSCEWSCGWSCGWLWITSPCICTWSCGTCVGGGLTSSPTDIRCSIPWTMKKKHHHWNTSNLGIVPVC